MPRGLAIPGATGRVPPCHLRTDPAPMRNRRGGGDMTTPAPGAAVRDLVPVASYDNYFDAQKAVDRLSDTGFPVERTAIIGVGLQMVENVLGRLNYGRAAATGAATGAWFGLLVGVFLSIFTDSLVSSVAIILWAVL